MKLALSIGLIGSLMASQAMADYQNGDSKNKKSKNKVEVQRNSKSSGNTYLFQIGKQKSFGIKVDPILGYRQSKQESDLGGIDRIESEIGISGALKNINIIPGNPGLSLTPYVGYTWGYRRESYNGIISQDAQDSGYTRLFYGLETAFTYRWFKQTLGLEKGDLKYDTDFERVQSNVIWADSGILFLPFLSGHYTYTYRTVFQDSMDELYYKESDNWLHASIYSLI